MIKYLRDCVRGLILKLIEDASVSDLIELSDGRRLKAIGVNGMQLLCQDSDSSTRLVFHTQAKDIKQWARVWKSLGGVVPRWEDGTEFHFYR